MASGAPNNAIMMQVNGIASFSARSTASLRCRSPSAPARRCSAPAPRSAFPPGLAARRAGPSGVSRMMRARRMRNSKRALDARAQQIARRDRPAGVHPAVAAVSRPSAVTTMVGYSGPVPDALQHRSFMSRVRSGELRTCTPIPRRPGTRNWCASRCESPSRPAAPPYAAPVGASSLEPHGRDRRGHRGQEDRAAPADGSDSPEAFAAVSSECRPIEPTVNTVANSTAAGMHQEHRIGQQVDVRERDVRLGEPAREQPVQLVGQVDDDDEQREAEHHDEEDHGPLAQHVAVEQAPAHQRSP